MSSYDSLWRVSFVDTQANDQLAPGPTRASLIPGPARASRVARVGLTRAMARAVTRFGPDLPACRRPGPGLAPTWCHPACRSARIVPACCHVYVNAVKALGPGRAARPSQPRARSQPGTARHCAARDCRSVVMSYTGRQVSRSIHRVAVGLARSWVLRS